MPETFIPVGGMHVAEDPGEIPDGALKDFVDGAEHGVVLISMGMSLQPTAFPEHVLAAIFGACRRLPQRVVMNLDVQPKRVRVHEYFIKFLNPSKMHLNCSKGILPKWCQCSLF